MINVSVIIPVYNVEQYLEEAIKSVMNQTLKNIEIIIINDGSTDKSEIIIENYLKVDKRIVLIKQKNKGQSVARNQGIKKARGKYIYFMDSDDFIEQETLEKCYLECEKNKLELICFDAITFLDTSANNFDCKLLNYNRNFLKENRIYSGKEIISKSLKNKKYIVSPCLYFFKKSILQEKKIKFYEGIIYEDTLFTTLLLTNIEKLMYLSNRFYYRRYRRDSIMTSKIQEKNLKSLFLIFKELEKYRVKKLKDRLDIKNFNKILSDILSKIFSFIILNENLKSNCEKISILKKKYRKYLNLKIKIKIYFSFIYIKYKKIQKLIIKENYGI